MKKITTFIKVLIFSIVLAFVFKWWTTGNPFQPSTILFGVTFLIQIWTGITIGSKFFAHFMDKPIQQIKKLIIPYFILCVFIILLVCMVIIGLSLYLYYLIMEIDTTDFLARLFQIEYPNAIKYAFFFVLPASAFFFYKVWKEAVDNEQRLREENLKYQYRTLKAQVNPHFLFNSLNTLSEIVYVDAKQADIYIQKLAGIYRYILDHEETDLISLNKELEFVRQYFDLQKERDGNKIHLDIYIENANQFKIIPISLQILVENALKHNSASEKEPLKIYIYDNDGYIAVSNNIQKKSILNDSSGTGLTNLQQRVKLITGKDIVLIQEHHLFIVKLPIISI